MKRVLAVAICGLFIPAAASGMERMTETELAAIEARAGGPSEMLAAESAGGSTRDAVRMHDRTPRNPSAPAGPSASGVSRTGSGIAIMINDVVIYTNNAGREIWYQTGSAALGLVWQDGSGRATHVNAITDADRF